MTGHMTKQNSQSKPIMSYTRKAFTPCTEIEVNLWYNVRVFTE